MKLIVNPHKIEIEDLKEMITGEPLYYPLATPTYIHITAEDYPTLYTQLENINNINSNTGTTNISQINENLSFNIKASALYDINNLITRVETLETEV